MYGQSESARLEILWYDSKVWWVMFGDGVFVPGGVPWRFDPRHRRFEKSPWKSASRLAVAQPRGERGAGRVCWADRAYLVLRPLGARGVSVCESTERRLCTKENPRPMAWSKRTGPAALAVIDRSQIKEHFKVRVRVMVHGHGFGRKSKLEPEVPPGIPLSSSSKLSELFVSTCDHWSTRTLTRLQALHAALN